MNPRNPAQLLSEIALNFAPTGGAELDLAIDLTQALRVPSPDGATLPSGKPVPISGLSASDALSFPIAGGISRVYVAFGKDTAIVGTALIIQQFDALSHSVGGLDVFLPFAFKTEISGVAGIFTSPSPSQSRLAVFVDASSVIPKPEPQVIPLAHAMFALDAVPATTQQRPIRLDTVNPSTRTVKAFKNAIRRQVGPGYVTIR